MARHTAATAWEFCTSRFRVALEIEPEQMDPADSFEFAEDIAAVRNGDVEWFAARVAVYMLDHEDGTETEIGSDSLGGCAYKTVREFYTSHRDRDPMNRNCTLYRAKHGENHVICDYFPSMVREAIGEARRYLTSRVTAMCA